MQIKRSIFFMAALLAACARTTIVAEPTPTAFYKLDDQIVTQTPVLTTTPAPVFETIGNPFPLEWGAPRIWSNDSFNDLFNPDRIDDHHGHVDIAVPEGYSLYDGFDIDNHSGDVLAPVSGCVSTYSVDPSDYGNQNLGLHLVLSDNIYIEGIEKALIYAGVENPDLKNISSIRIDLGHVKDVKEGCFYKGDIIAEVEPFNPYQGQTKLGMNIFVYYLGEEYAFSPTLFTIDDPQWICFEGSPYDCEPEPHDYAPDTTYIVLQQPFICGDTTVDIYTNASFNGLFKPDGFDQYHGHMDIIPPDGCDINTDQMLSPLTGFIERYDFYEPDAGGTNWGYHLIFPSGVYPSGIEDAFKFAHVDNFDIDQIASIILDIGHLECKTGPVTAGEPICTVVPMPEIYGITRIAMQIGVNLKDGRGYMFSPTLFKWTGNTWGCEKVPQDGYCYPEANYYK